MARISGVDIPREKRLEVALTYIYGVGRSTALKMCKDLGIDHNQRVRNLTEEDFRRAVAAIAPTVLFPYARATIANLVSLGGFPQMLLPPVNFDALYARSLAEAAAQQQTEAPPALDS